MTIIRSIIIAALVGALPAAAQQGQVKQAGTTRDSAAATSEGTDTLPTKKSPVARAPRYIAPTPVIQYIRPADQRGLTVFESPKDEGVAYTGFRLAWGGAFAQQYQNLTHQNTAAPRVVSHMASIHHRQPS